MRPGSARAEGSVGSRVRAGQDSQAGSLGYWESDSLGDWYSDPVWSYVLSVLSAFRVRGADSMERSRVAVGRERVPTDRPFRVHRTRVMILSREPRSVELVPFFTRTEREFVD